MFRCLVVSSVCLAFAREACEQNGSCNIQEPVSMLQAASKMKANCTGSKCGRGHPAWMGPISVLQSDEGVVPEFQVQEDGTWNTYFLPGASITDKRAVTYGINDKYYLMKYNTADYSKADNFKMIQLNGKTLITEVNLNGAGCGCNVNFFMVSMPAASPGQYGDYYCDGNCVGGNCCPEFDTNEMNTNALQVTNHNCWNPWSKNTCDGNGDPEMKFYPGEYGPGGNNAIDTNKPFFFSVQVREVIVGDGSPDNHLIVETRAWQGDKVVAKSMGGVNNPMNGMWGNFANGMVLVIDYWQSQDLTWLDGSACHAPEYCSGNKATLSNMQLISNDNPQLSASCPSSDGSDCSWAHQGNGACNNDDASEGWCRCCCTETALVPRCLWSGYSAF